MNKLYQRTYLDEPKNATQKYYRENKEEIAKCDVVCSNCHKLRTWRIAL